MAQLILPVAGAIIGGIFGGPAGAQAGFAIGSVISGVAGIGVPDVKGPRLDDLKGPKASYGSVIPYVEGHPRLPGVIVWCSDKREVENTTSAGKGGPEQTSYTYVIDVLIALAENDIGAGRRVWSNGELVWSIADDASSGTIVASGEAPWSRITFYNGAEDQLPDPTYEAAVGTDNAPAYRDRTTVFIENLDLGGSGQIPILTFECSGNALPLQPSKAIRLYKELGAGKLLSRDVPLGAFVANSDGTFEYNDISPTEYSGELMGMKPAEINYGVGGPGVEQSLPPTVKVELPEYVYAQNAGQGNGDIPVVVFGVAKGAAGFHIAGEGVNLTVQLQDPNDNIGNVDIRYSIWQGKLAIGSLIPLGTGVGAFAGATGASCSIYLYELDGTYLDKVAVGTPMSSIAMNGSSVYAMTDGVVKHYAASDLAFEADIDLPDGTGHRIFTTAQGLLACANAQAEIYTYSGGWTLLVQLETDALDPVDDVTPVDLGTTACIHMVDGPYAFAADIYEKLSATLVPKIQFSLSGFQGSDIQESSLEAAVVGNGVANIWQATTAFNGPRPVRNTGWHVASIEPGPVSSFITGILQYNVVYTWQMLYGFAGDSSPAGWYDFVGYGVFQEYYVNADPLVYPPTPVYAIYRQTIGGMRAGLSKPTLQEVVERQCERAGIPAEYVDATNLATRFVSGMPLTQIVSPRNVIDTLARGYFFTAVESEVLRFRFLGAATVATIPYEAMGAALDTADPDPLAIALSNDTELPVQVYVKYINGDDDYQDGTEQSFRVTNSPGNAATTELALVFTPTEAKRIADVTVLLGKSTSTRFGPFALSRDFAHLEPTDAVFLTDKAGNTYRARLTTKNESQGVLTFEGVLDDATILNSAAQTAGGYTSSSVVTPKVATEFAPLDIPLLRDADDATGIYWGAGGATGWAGAAWLQSADEATFDRVASTERNTIIGTTVGTLANWTGGQFFDEATVLRVNIPYGQLASYTRDDVLNNTAGAYLVGSEVIQARNATLVSAGVYDLTGLLRGRRGTEWAMAGHAADERFVVLNEATLNRQALNVSDIGRTLHWKAVTFGRLAATANSESLTFAAVSQKPFSPVDLRGARDSGDLALTWRRRTRLSTNFHAHLYPLGEATEAYQVVVYADNTYAVVKRVISTTSPTAAYSSADQTTDFGSPQAIVYTEVFHISATAGRGYALRGAI